MRILIVTHGFPPRQVTGTEWHSYILARELSKRHEVYVFSRSSGSQYSEYKENFDGIPITRMDTPRGWSTRTRFPETYIDDRVALSFSSLIEEFKPDVVHIQHCVGLGLSILEATIERKIPVLLFLHDFYFICHRLHLLKPDEQICSGPKDSRYCAGCISESNPSLSDSEAYELGLDRHHYINKLLSNIDCIVAPSKFVKTTFQNNYSSINKIILSPLGLDLSFKEQFKKKSHRNFRFGYIGAIFRHKGIHILMEAFKNLQLENLELRIHGDGDPSYLNDLKKISNDNIFFLGLYTHEELARVLSEIDVAVLPSTCHESYSFTIREALAVGIPVVVSDLEAQSEAIIEEHNGLHFRSGDKDHLRATLQRLASDSNYYRKLSDIAKKSPIVSIENQSVELENLYKNLLDESVKKNVTSTFPSGRPLSNLLSYIRNLESRKLDLEDKIENVNFNLAAQKELESIKKSLGYKFMRFYASRLDRLFPEETKQGHIRKWIVRTINSITRRERTP